MRGEDIVWADPGDEILEWNTVLGLRHVIEARVIHQRRRVAHPTHPDALRTLSAG